MKKIDYYHNYCKCGCLKQIQSRRCIKCFAKGKHKQLSRRVDKGFNNEKEKNN